FFSSRRRHTRSDRDWSSDVCSSDLQACIADVINNANDGPPRRLSGAINKVEALPQRTLAREISLCECPADNSHIRMACGIDICEIPPFKKANPHCRKIVGRNGPRLEKNLLVKIVPLYRQP